MAEYTHIQFLTVCVVQRACDDTKTAFFFPLLIPKFLAGYVKMQLADLQQKSHKSSIGETTFIGEKKKKKGKIVLV